MSPRPGSSRSSGRADPTHPRRSGCSSGLRECAITPTLGDFLVNGVPAAAVGGSPAGRQSSHHRAVRLPTPPNKGPPNTAHRCGCPELEGVARLAANVPPPIVTSNTSTPSALPPRPTSRRSIARERQHHTEATSTTASASDGRHRPQCLRSVRGCVRLPTFTALSGRSRSSSNRGRTAARWG